MYTYLLSLFTYDLFSYLRVYILSLRVDIVDVTCSLHLELLFSDEYERLQTRQTEQAACQTGQTRSVLTGKNPFTIQSKKSLFPKSKLHFKIKL